MLFPSFILSLAALVLAAPQPESKRDTTSKADIAKWLDPHNALRAQHGAKPLVWNSTLADYANNWAGKCVFQPSGGPYGENIAGGGDPANITGEVALWTSEASKFNPKDPQNMDAGHFTQIVWKGTTQLGCALAPFFPQRSTDNSGAQCTRFAVCSYYPPGNFLGQYPQNVQA